MASPVSMSDIIIVKTPLDELRITSSCSTREVKNNKNKIRYQVFYTRKEENHEEGTVEITFNYRRQVESKLSFVNVKLRTFELRMIHTKNTIIIFDAADENPELSESVLIMAQYDKKFGMKQREEIYNSGIHPIMYLLNEIHNN